VYAGLIVPMAAAALLGHEAAMARIAGVLVLTYHLPMQPRPVLAALMAWSAWELSLPQADIIEPLVLLGLALLAARRIALLGVTLSASTPASLLFIPTSHLMPRYSFSDTEFFRADGCSEAVARQREQSFEALQRKWTAKWVRLPRPVARARALF